MASSINASLTAGLVQTADTSGIINLQSGGTTIVAVTSTGAAVTGTLSSTGNTTLGDASTDTLNVGAGNLVTDASGNVGVGVTPSAWYASSRAVQIGAGGALETRSNYYPYLSITSNVYLDSGGLFKTLSTNASSRYVVDAGVHSWNTAPSVTAGSTATFTQAMTLDASGRLLIGQTTASNSVNGLYFDPAGGGSANIVHASGTASGTGYAFFLYAGSSIGSITQNGTTGVLYNLTSDYRLKDNPEALLGAKDFIMALQPKTWDWWDGSGKGVGFIAHEFMEVTKYSGNGDKDATKEEQYEISPAIPAVLDEEGNEIIPAVEAEIGTRTVPIYQSIQPSSSEVMANIVAFIQEQQALITSLTARLDEQQVQISVLQGAK